MKYTHCKNASKHVFVIIIASMCPLITQALDQQPQTKQKNSISVDDMSW